MNKLKLLALIYSPEDKKTIDSWITTHSNSFEIVEWSQALEVPLQSAVNHYRETEGIDGLLIDDHSCYDSIVLNRLKDLLLPTKVSLYSAANSNLPLIQASDHAPAAASENANCVPMLHAVTTEATTSPTPSSFQLASMVS